MFEISEEQDRSGQEGAKIKVIGIGGGGCNAVNTMIKAGLTKVEYIVANTDSQALGASLAPTKVQLGAEVTKGLGAGANPEVGRKAALDEYEKLSEVLEDADMVFITAGYGWGNRNWGISSSGQIVQRTRGLDGGSGYSTLCFMKVNGGLARPKRVLKP